MRVFPTFLNLSVQKGFQGQMVLRTFVGDVSER